MWENRHIFIWTRVVYTKVWNEDKVNLIGIIPIEVFLMLISIVSYEFLNFSLFSRKILIYSWKWPYTGWVFDLWIHFNRRPLRSEESLLDIGCGKSIKNNFQCKDFYRMKYVSSTRRIFLEIEISQWSFGFSVMTTIFHEYTRNIKSIIVDSKFNMTLRKSSYFEIMM